LLEVQAFERFGSVRVRVKALETLQRMLKPKGAEWCVLSSVARRVKLTGESCSHGVNQNRVDPQMLAGAGHC